MACAAHQEDNQRATTSQTQAERGSAIQAKALQAYGTLPLVCCRLSPAASAPVVRPTRLPPEFSWRSRRSSPPRRRPPSRRPRSRTIRGSQNPRLGPLFPAADFLLDRHPRLVMSVVSPLVPTGGGEDSRSAVGGVFSSNSGQGEKRQDMRSCHETQQREARVLSPRSCCNASAWFGLAAARQQIGCASHALFNGLKGVVPVGAEVELFWPACSDTRFDGGLL